MWSVEPQLKHFRCAFAFLASGWKALAGRLEVFPRSSSSSLWSSFLLLGAARWIGCLCSSLTSTKSILGSFLRRRCPEPNAGESTRGLASMFTLNRSRCGALESKRPSIILRTFSGRWPCPKPLNKPFRFGARLSCWTGCDGAGGCGGAAAANALRILSACVSGRGAGSSSLLYNCASASRALLDEFKYLRCVEGAFRVAG